MFENQYLTYSEYLEMGGTIGEMPFNLLEHEVKKIINVRTQYRLIKLIEIPDDVKICIRKMIDVIDNYTKVQLTGSGNVASESTDGYSVTYATGSQIQEIIKTNKVELEDIMFHYLSGVSVDGVSILYLGVI